LWFYKTAFEAANLQIILKSEQANFFNAANFAGNATRRLPAAQKPAAVLL